MSRTPWWRTYFDDAYFAMHDPLFDEQRSRREVAGMRELLGLHDGARVLDAPCGWGRHTGLLAGAGCDAVGADISHDLLRHAPRTAVSGRGLDTDDDTPTLAPVYAAADIRALPFADACFDAVVNVFTSLGLFLDDDEDVAALREARRVLRPGGALLLESMHRDEIIAQYATRDRWTLPDGTQVRVRRRFDAVSGISHERLQWRRGEQRGRKAHSLRLRTATELAALLEAAGFAHVDWFGSWEGAPFRHSDESVIAVARG